MSNYNELKDELARIVEAHYQGGTRINDIRAAIYSVDLMAEQFSAIELLEIAKSMGGEKASPNV
jgi:hypothetical protein